MGLPAMRTHLPRRRLVGPVAGALVAGLCACSGVAGPDPGVPATGTSVQRSPAEGNPGPDSGPDPSIFEYADHGPVRVRTLGTRIVGPVRVREVDYPSPRGGTVTATISTPRSRPTPAAVILLHGMPLDRNDMRIPALVYACAGSTTIAIDAPYVRTGQGTITFTRLDRTAQIQFITDLRRGLDLLEQEGATQVSLLGISYGATMGALLAGVDDRIGSAALLVGDGGLVAHMTDADGVPVPPLSEVPRDQAAAWLDRMRPIEPVLYVGASDAAFLLLNGRHDTLVDESDAELLHEAVGENGEARWYDTGHDLTVDAYRYQFHWVGSSIGLDPDRLAGCVDELGQLGESP